MMRRIERRASIFTLLLTMVVCGFALAQETVRSPITVDDLQKIIEAFSSGNAAVGWRIVANVLIGFYLPLLGALIMRTKWTTETKTFAGWCLSFVLAGFLTALQEGRNITFSLEGIIQFSAWLLTQFAIINTIAKQTHDTLWKSLGIRRLEEATDY